MKLIRGWRRQHGEAADATTFDLRPVYRLALSQHPRARTDVLRRAFRTAVEPVQALDATFAALALVVAASDRARAEGLVSFLELCYSRAELEAGTATLGVSLEDSRPAEISALRHLDCKQGWEALAASVREVAASMPATRPEPSWPALGLPGPKQIVARLSGGLGNQMFQYAAALGHARRIGATLRLDLANYEDGADDREFLLGRLQVPVRRANSYEVLRARLRPHWERLGTFDDFMFQHHGSTWICGFWEDEAYFTGIVETVRRRFRPRSSAVVAAAEALIQQNKSFGHPVIGVHMRRGDRAPGGRAFAPFSTLPAEYFREAAGTFPPDANFLVFSDSPEDIAWCRQNLGLGSSERIGFSDGRDPILDLWALTLCDHVILSSGTFSWWGGYLGDRPGRRVVVPNPLQALSAERVMLPVPMPPRPGWEVITLPPGSVS
ncbi:MAG: alpha-1,2-fucosyltransferase [Dehalococcoidia bacterium]